MQLEGFRSYFGAIMSVYQISLGSWAWDSIYEGGPIAIMFFVAYTIIGTIMLLNLLIAVRRARSNIFQSGVLIPMYFLRNWSSCARG